MERSTMQIRELVAALYPLERHIVSDGLDRALEIVGEHLPSESNYRVENVPPNTPVWTWEVPKRYVVHEAYLDTEDGERIIDVSDNPLHLMSYSISVDSVLEWDELQPHLFSKPLRGKARDVIPWEFSYYEERWGFSLTQEQFERLDRSKRYRAVVRTEFLSEQEKGLRTGVACVTPSRGVHADFGEILVCAHICHPHMANDDAAGVAVAVEVARRLSAVPLTEGSMAVRFLFCPETIGSVAYISRNEELIPRFRGGIFIEMPGNRNSIVLQRSWQGDHLMDRVSEYVLKRACKTHRTGAFREVISNDELVMNGPGVNAPTVSFSRWPYPEYHTDADNLEIIHEDMLSEMADVVEDTLRIFASNYVPVRNFKGPIFLSGHGLWVDWRTNPELNRALELIMLMLEGDMTVFDIAVRFNLEYWEVWDYLEKLRKLGFVRREPIPREPF